MKKYTLQEIILMLTKASITPGNDPMVQLINKIKKDKKLLNRFLEMINPALVHAKDPILVKKILNH